MTLIYLLGAFFSVTLAFEYSAKVGGLLVLIYVLGILYVAQQKGVIQ
jgi:hypothetical protein